MISPLSSPRASFSRSEPRFAGETSQKAVGSSASRELSQGTARFLPSLSTFVLTGMALAGSAVASQHTNLITNMNKQIVELTKQLSTFPLSKPMGWGQWAWEKVAVPGGMLASLGGGIFTFFLQKQAIINLKRRVRALEWA